MLSTLIFMAIGMFIGAKLFPPKLQKYNSILQQVCVFLLIFSMGVSLGSGPTFWEDLKTVGWESAVFALATIAGSILFVWLLTRKLPRPEGEPGPAEKEATEAVAFPGGAPGEAEGSGAGRGEQAFVPGGPGEKSLHNASGEGRKEP